MPQQISSKTPVDADPTFRRAQDSRSPSEPDKLDVNDGIEINGGNEIQESPCGEIERLSGSSPLRCTLTTNSRTIHGELVDLTRRVAKLKVSQALRFAQNVTLCIDAPQLKIAVEVLAKVDVIRSAGDDEWLINCGFVAIPQDVIDALANAGLIQRRLKDRHSANLKGTARFELQTETVHVRLKDCSSTGFCVVATRPGTIGASVVVELDDDALNGRGRCSVSGKIRWQIVQDGSYLLGCLINGDKNQGYLDLIGEEDSIDDAPRSSLQRPQLGEITAGILYLTLVGGVSLAIAFFTGGVSTDARSITAGIDTRQRTVDQTTQFEAANPHQGLTNKQGTTPRLDSGSDQREADLGLSGRSSNLDNRSETFNFPPISSPRVDDKQSRSPTAIPAKSDEASSLTHDHTDTEISRETSGIDDDASPFTFVPDSHLLDTLQPVGDSPKGALDIAAQDFSLGPHAPDVLRQAADPLAEKDITAEDWLAEREEKKPRTTPPDQDSLPKGTGALQRTIVPSDNTDHARSTHVGNSKLVESEFDANATSTRLDRREYELDFPRFDSEQTASLELTERAEVQPPTSTNISPTEDSHNTSRSARDLASDAKLSRSHELDQGTHSQPAKAAVKEAPNVAIAAPAEKAKPSQSTTRPTDSKTVLSRSKIAADDYLRGVEYYRSRKFEEALEPFLSSIRNAPNEVLYHYLLAMTYYQLSQPTKADAAIRRAIALERTYPMLDQGRRLSRFRDAAGRWATKRRLEERR